MNALAIKKMSTIEKLQTMEILWDALLHDENNIKLPAWHGGILEERMEKLTSGKAEFVTLEELKSRHHQ